MRLATRSTALLSCRTVEIRPSKNGYRGWYEVVIKPAVLEAGFEPVLAATEEHPSAINDEIRTHLALDQMVVVDLGGTEPGDDPNPNVMYELGIRHALGLPLVMMAWKGQRLPFDVGNQRVIAEDRELIDLDTNRKKLVSFIHAAHQGKFYRPMDAVGRIATIQAASETLGEDSVLRALAQEVQDLRMSLAQPQSQRDFRFRRPKAPTVKSVIQGKPLRKDLYGYYLEIAGKPDLWPRVLRTPVSAEEAERMKEWGASEWKEYLATRVNELSKEVNEAAAAMVDTFLDPMLLQRIKGLLPPQPWPDGIHKTMAAEVGLTYGQVAKYIDELIRQGLFMEQVDGKLFPYGTEG